jgi:hypothetical protein
MKPFKIVSNIFLSVLLFVGCTDEFDMEFPTRQPTYQGTINLTQVMLNPTEQILKGKWFLRSMSTKDSVYNDSILNRQKTIRFTEFAYPGETYPILEDDMGLYKRVTPGSYVYFERNITWYAPDSSTMTINYKEFNGTKGTLSFGIAMLELYQLTLVDNSTGTIWNFER